jgi:hypothetical protein
MNFIDYTQFVTLANQHLEMLREEAQIQQQLHQKPHWRLSQLLPQKAKSKRPNPVIIEQCVAAK